MSDVIIISITILIIISIIILRIIIIIIIIIIVIIIIIRQGLLSGGHTAYHARLRKRTSRALPPVLTPFASFTRQLLHHFFPDFSFKSGFGKIL